MLVWNDKTSMTAVDKRFLFAIVCWVATASFFVATALAPIVDSGKGTRGASPFPPCDDTNLACNVTGGIWMTCVFLLLVTPSLACHIGCTRHKLGLMIPTFAALAVWTPIFAWLWRACVNVCIRTAHLNMNGAGAVGCLVMAYVTAILCAACR